MEVLTRPQVLVIGKLYPLDLEIFTKVKYNYSFESDFIYRFILFQILKLAYSMFNILQNLK